MAALCKAQKELQLGGFVHSMAFCKETHNEDTLSFETPDTSQIETPDTSLVEAPDTSSVEALEEVVLSGIVHSMAFCKETHNEDTSPVETPDTSPVETPDTSPVETPDTSPVGTPDTSLVRAPDTSSVEALEEVVLSGIVHSMTYCKETCDLLLCDWANSRIEQFSHSSSSGLSLQPQKLWKLREMHGISRPTSVQTARIINSIFIGCDFNEGIYVLDRKSFQLIKKFAQNMNRDFDHMVVDETEASQGCMVYASSRNNGTLTKFDYSSGSMIDELSFKFPSNLLLKEDKLYLNCVIDSTSCVQVIDKHSLEVQSKFALSGWSLLGGLCLGERGDVCVTARNKSNHRMLYSFDDGGKVVDNVKLPEFHYGAYVLDMIAVDNDLFILTQEYEEFFLKRFPFKF